MKRCAPHFPLFVAQGDGALGALLRAELQSALREHADRGAGHEEAEGDLYVRFALDSQLGSRFQYISDLDDRECAGKAYRKACESLELSISLCQIPGAHTKSTTPNSQKKITTNFTNPKIAEGDGVRRGGHVEPRARPPTPPPLGHRIRQRFGYKGD